MGTRVSTRLRPRMGDVWGYPPPFEDTAASIATYGYMFGPFTVAQLVELFWRVKEITVTWEITYDPGDGDVTSSGSVVLFRQNDASEDITDESELIVANPPHSNGPLWAGASGPNLWTIILADFNWGKDENGEFWFSPSFDALDAFTVGDGTVYVTLTGGGGASAPSTLNLTTGSVSLPTRAYAPGMISDATVTVEITEWFPYATRAGTAAWNTATGAAANGGPAA